MNILMERLEYIDMKCSFSLLELILSLIISSIVIIYSSLLLKNIFIENIDIQKNQSKKLDILNTKLFLEKHKDEIAKLQYIDKKLYFDNSLLLKNVKEFFIKIDVNQVEIKINYDDYIKQSWVL